MRVDFNNVRLRAIQHYNQLIKMLNQSIVEDTDMNRVVIPVQDLQRTLDLLRDEMITIGLAENDSDCKCVITDDMKILEFNPED